MVNNIDRHLIINALQMPVWVRQPTQRVLVRSDQGSQYGSSDYLAFMKTNNLEPSMSRRGNYHDNAVAESFFATFKKRVVKKKTTQHVKTLSERYSTLLKCFTIQ